MALGEELLPRIMKNLEVMLMMAGRLLSMRARQFLMRKVLKNMNNLVEINLDRKKRFALGSAATLATILSPVYVVGAVFAADEDIEVLRGLFKGWL